MARVRVSLGRLWQRVATRENAWALALFGILTLIGETLLARLRGTPRH